MSWHLASPATLLLLLGLPLLALLHWQRLHRELGACEDFALASAWRKMRLTPATRARQARGWLMMGALACLIVALAQPRWGAAGAAGVVGGQGNVVLVLDVSKSMRVMDTRGMGRLQQGLGVIDEVLEAGAGWRFGVVAFAGEAEVLCPLTTDLEAVRTLLARARAGAGVGKGSDPEAGLRAAATLFPGHGPRFMVLLSDGERLSGDSRAPAAEAWRRGIVTHALGLGSAEGGPVPGEPDMWGNPTFLSWRGEPVTSRADFLELAAIAAAGGGGLVDGGGGGAAASLIERLGMGATEVRAETGGSARGWELFQWPLVGALALLLAELFTAVPRRPRPTWQFQDVLRATLGRAGQGLAILGLCSTLGGATWYPLWLVNREAQQAATGGQTARAEALLQEAVTRAPDDARLQYNLGSVRYEAGKLAEAEQALQAALAGASAAERPWVRYNLGNVHFRMAERTGAREGYERAIADWRAALAERPDDEDARHNIAAAERRLADHPVPPSPAPSRPQPSKAGQPPPVGVRTHYRPPPLRQLPSPEEVNAALAALERDERQRQAEAPPASPDAGSGLPDPGRLIEQALQGLELEKDW